MKAIHFLVTSVIFLSVVGILQGAEQKSGEQAKTVAQLYPNLASGILTYATVNTLPEGILLKTPDIQITQSDIESAITKQPPQLQQELTRNGFFVLEQHAAENLLKKLAKQELANGGDNVNFTKENRMIAEFFESVTKDINVTTGDIETFYKENESVFCGTPLEKVRKQIESYVLQDKKERFIDEYIKTVGQRIDIQVSDVWTQKQAQFAKDNPLDKARTSGKPTLAVFSSKSCCGPDKMLPVIDTVKEKTGDKINIVYIEPRQEQILSARYGIRSIPAQIFYDASGKEIFRHNGFFSDKDIFAKLSDIGIK
jgi:thiol-disulfide isomerase/thioredoxin